MLGSSTASRTTCDFAENLGHHRGHVASFGKVVPVRSMTAPNSVRSLKRRTDPGSHCLLPNVQVAWCLDLTHFHEIRHPFFEHTNTHHCGVHLQELWRVLICRKHVHLPSNFFILH